MPSTHGSWQLQDLWMDSRKGNCVQKLGPLQLHETRSGTLHHGSYKNCSDGTEEKHADLLTFLEKARSAQKPVAYITTGGCAGRVNSGSVLGSRPWAVQVAYSGISLILIPIELNWRVLSFLSVDLNNVESTLV